MRKYTTILFLLLGVVPLVHTVKMEEKETNDPLPMYFVEDPLLTTSTSTSSSAHDGQRVLMDNTTYYNPTPMVIGGIEPDIDYDYMVWLPNAGCSGFLIRPCILLTAAHCNVNKGHVAQIGRSEIKSTGVTVFEEIKIAHSIPHPDYSPPPPMVKVHPDDYDYRVVLLEKRSNVKTFPTLAGKNYKLPVQNETSAVTLLGYGVTEAIATEGSLQQLDTKILGTCPLPAVIIPFLPTPPLTDRMFCTYKDNVSLVCNGDSGGPVLDRSTNPPQAVGIISFVYGNQDDACDTSLPSQHASIPNKFDWIKETYENLERNAKNHGSACGDPHFRTFDKHFFSYHGQCDLVLTRSKSFGFGSGLDVHIRTTRVDNNPNGLHYSFISAVAVKIGDDILEVNEDGDLIINGHTFVLTSKHRHITSGTSTTTDGTKHFGGRSSGSATTSSSTPSASRTSSSSISSIQDAKPPAVIFAGLYAITRSTMGSKSRIIVYNLDVGNDKTIQIRVNTKNGMLFIDVDGAFEDSEGLLGAHPSQDKPLLARDGVTDLTGAWNTYGEDWQVNEEDPKIFQDMDRRPQFPVGCVYQADPKQKSHFRRRRRLFGVEEEDNMVTFERASKACGHLSDEMKNFCITDIMATGDLELLEDPFYATNSN